MATDAMSEVECRRMFLERRAMIPAQALDRHAGRWIAWSPDGARIVADAEIPEDLASPGMRAHCKTSISNSSVCTTRPGSCRTRPSRGVM